MTNNHPLLTALVVVAHLSEDMLYYARLLEMETSTELFSAHLEKTRRAQREAWVRQVRPRSSLFDIILILAG